MKNKRYHKKRTPHWYIDTSLLLRAFKQRHSEATSYRLSKSLYSRSVLFKRTKKFGSLFTNGLDHRIYETKFPTQVSFLFSILYLSYPFNSSFDAQDLPFIHDCHLVITLPVSCQLQEKKHKGKLKAQSELPLLLSFPGLEFM